MSNSVSRTLDMAAAMINLLSTRLTTLETAIRTHRDQRGDDRCWMDDEVLYQTLPEGYMPPRRDTEVELSRCQQFIRNRKNPRTEYVSPQRRIEELEAALAQMLSVYRTDPCSPGRIPAYLPVGNRNAQEMKDAEKRAREALNQTWRDAHEP